MNSIPTGLNQPTSIDPRPDDKSPTIPEFELHYDFDSRYSVMHVLQSIEEDLSSQSSVHDWDDKLVDDL